MLVGYFCDSLLQEFQKNHYRKSKRALLASKDFLSEQDTVKFWCDFLFQKSLPYIITKNRNWGMWTGSIRQLVAVYAAFDSQT